MTQSVTRRGCIVWAEFGSLSAIVSVIVINDILPLDSILLSYASVINAITSSERATVMAQINKLYYHRR